MWGNIMDKLIEILNKLKQNSGKILWIPLILSSITFIANLVLALSDGAIDEQEFHTLTQQASGAEMLVLAFVMALLKFRK